MTDYNSRGDPFAVLRAAPRREILRLLRDREGSYLTVDEVAAALGVHRTVAFAHLQALTAAGLVERARRDGLRGRPAHTYRSLGSVELSQPLRRHRLLATLLARALEVGTGPAAARRVGREYGRGLQSLAELGGDYHLEGSEIHAANCIFQEACGAAREVVCGLQAGVLEGALGRAVTEMGPDGRGGCSYRTVGDPAPV